MPFRTTRTWLGGASALLLAFLAPAQQVPTPPDQPMPWVGERGVVETVDQIMERERLHPDDSDQRKPKRIQPDRSGLPQDPMSPAVPRWPFDGRWNSPESRGYPSIVEQHVGLEGQEAPQTPSTTFTAANLGVSGFIPPDTMGDVSPTQVLTVINGRIRVHDKNGTLGALNASLNTFFNSVRNASSTADPFVVWDRTSSRWFVSAFNVSTPNRILLAVSSGATITGTASFTFYFFQHDLVGTTPNVDTGRFADYVSMGVDANAVYMGGNMFSTSFQDTTLWVVRKSSVTSGGPIVVTAFRDLITTDGPYSPRGVTNDDPAATEGYAIGVSSAAFGRLVMRRISTPGGTPTISSNIIVTVPTTVDPQTVPAQGSTTNIDVTDERLFQARVFRNRSTGVRTLWVSHSIEVNSSGVASASGNRDGARWYQLQSLTTTPSLAMSGTLFDSSASTVHYIFPSCAMTGQGHMAIGASSGGPSEFMGVSVAGRLAGDAAGTTQARTVAQAGLGSYTITEGSSPFRNRWGDYSTTVVDPADDQTIWTFQEFAEATDSWAVRVVRLLAPPPATPVTLAPNTIAQGATNVAMTLTGTSSAGSAFYDTEAGMNRIAALFSGTGLTVNSVTRNSDTSLSLVVSATAGAASGPRNLTITNPDGQTATGNSLLTVTGGACVPAGVGTHPSSTGACAGTGAAFSVVGSGTTPFTYQWRKNTVNIGGATASTYSIVSVSAGDAGSYDCVVTNACGNATSNAATLTINTAPSISSQPGSLALCPTLPASFSVTATGSPTPTFQWRKNGSNISGATSSTYSITSVGDLDAGSFDCVVTNACGTATSNAATLSVHVPAGITSFSGGTTGCEGISALFAVNATGSPSPTFQWQKNGINIPGANASVYNIASAVVADSGTYRCIVSNTCGSATSTTGILTVRTTAEIATQPAPVAACEGSPAMVFVLANSESPITYQWRRNSVNVPGAVGPSYSIASLTPAHAGSYDCIVTNACGSVTTAAATITVNTAPSITANPADSTVCAGAPASFTAAAASFTTPTFQWRKDTVNISGATSATYTIAAAAAADAGAYDCVVGNPCGSAITQPAALTVNTAPAITADPTGASLCPTNSVVFTVSASGTPAPAFQWRFNGDPIVGAAASSYSIGSVTPGDAGSYDCVVTNACGSNTSAAAVLTVTVPCCDSIDYNGDGFFPDTADIDDFLSVFSGGPCSTGMCGDIDFNNDGFFPDTSDIDTYLSVFSGGPCV